MSSVAITVEVLSARERDERFPLQASGGSQAVGRGEKRPRCATGWLPQFAEKLSAGSGSSKKRCS